MDIIVRIMSSTAPRAVVLIRLAVIPTTVIMAVAIMTTKIPILVERGFWDMAHAARTDFAMLLGSVFLLAVGAGPWSVDSAIFRAARGGRRGRAARTGG